MKSWLVAGDSGFWPLAIIHSTHVVAGSFSLPRLAVSSFLPFCAFCRVSITRPPFSEARTLSTIFPHGGLFFVSSLIFPIPASPQTQPNPLPQQPPPNLLLHPYPPPATSTSPSPPPPPLGTGPVIVQPPPRRRRRRSRDIHTKHPTSRPTHASHIFQPTPPLAKSDMSIC